jgi:hypothetical protein
LAFGIAHTDIEGTRIYETCGFDEKCYCGTAVEEAEVLQRESGSLTVLGILCLVLAAYDVLYVMSKDFMISNGNHGKTYINSIFTLNIGQVEYVLSVFL